MRNIKATLIICGAIYIVEGFVFLVAPDRIADLYGFLDLSDSMKFLMTIIGSAFVAAGAWFIMAILDPIRNINVIKFAILWCSLFAISPLYGLWKGYVDFNQIWLGMAINAVFVAALLIFYPREKIET
ncbi:MAG: hypothetical protein GX226_00960 [Dehalococcoidales bacterium]|nr:hypothetical protein [Dehalococcoidales bacterium]